MLEQLKFLLTADDKARAAFAKVRREVTSLSGSAGALKDAFAGLGVQLAAGLSVAGVVAFTRSTINGIDALNDLKDATGASIANLSALEDVAARNGASLDTVGSALVKLTQQLNAARDPASEAAQAFKALGLDVDKLRELDDPADQLLAVAKALAKFEDNARKGSIQLVLFGKQTRDLSAFLKDTAEAGQLVGRVTDEQAAAAERFNKQLFALNKNVTDLARTMAGPLVESFNAAFAKLEQAPGYAEKLKLLFGAPFSKETRDKQMGLLGLNTGGASGEWDAAAPPGRPSLPTLPGNTSAATAAAKKAAADRLRLREDAAKAELEVERITAEETAEAWKYVNDSIVKNEADSVAARKLMMQQYFDWIDQQQESEIEQGQAYLKAIASTGKSIGEELNLVFSSAAGEAISQFKSLRDILKGVLGDILQIAFQRTAMPFIQQAVGAGLSALGLPMFASGGYVAPGTWGIVGEQGPELVYGGRSGGTVYPNGAGGGVTINQTLHVGSGVSRHEVAAAMVAARDSAVAAVAEAQRRGRTA